MRKLGRAENLSGAEARYRGPGGEGSEALTRPSPARSTPRPRAPARRRGGPARPPREAAARRMGGIGPTAAGGARPAKWRRLGEARESQGEKWHTVAKLLLVLLRGLRCESPLQLQSCAQPKTLTRTTDYLSQSDGYLPEMQALTWWAAYHSRYFPQSHLQ